MNSKWVIRTLAAGAFGLASTAALAQAGHDHHQGASSANAAKAASATQPALADGEIKKIDKKAGKLTIKHGPLKNLDMPAMTMAFKVKDPAMLEQAKVGSQVKFTVEQIGKDLVVTSLKVPS